MKRLLMMSLAAWCMTMTYKTFAQGCVAIRSGCNANLSAGASSAGSVTIGTNFRYFKSFRHFRGKTEEKHRFKEGTEVINKSTFLDLNISYGITDQLYVNAVIPYVFHARSSMYEHGGNPKLDNPETIENEFWEGERHSTFSSGLADVRLGLNFWLLDPEIAIGNLSVGAGIKFASGDYRFTDSFYNQGNDKSEVIISEVDQSIQPGDGGFGFTFELQGYHSVTDRLNLNGNLYYLLNPREKYEIENRGRIRAYSVPDQYAIRIGANYMAFIHGFSLYGGLRMEGIPGSDLIGGDEGFRRPGYVISAEPGINYVIRNSSMTLSVPIAIERNRTKNFSDKQNGRHGDAAFADLLINLGFNWRFIKKQEIHLDN